MRRPPLTGTKHVLPFDRLSREDFERLCLWLVEAEGYSPAKHYGLGGSDAGRDIVASRRENRSAPPWFFQAKQTKRLPFSALKKELDKVIAFRDSHPDSTSSGLIFMTSCPISAVARDQALAYASRVAMEIELWAITEMDMRAKQHPKILAEFFELDRQKFEGKAPRQIQEPSKDFVGRAKELAELLEKHAAGAAILGINGPGGVGKTALALTLVQRLKTTYPDAQVFLDMKGMSKQPLTPAQAIAYVIHSFDPEAPLPADEARLAEAYRGVLEGKKALLLLDNARGVRQIHPLNPPAGSLVVFTSRSNFRLPGSVEKRLLPLPLFEACELLRKIAPRLEGAKSKSIEKLAILCGRLPLALWAVGCLLHRRRDLSLSQYLRRLLRADRKAVLLAADPSVERSTAAALQTSYELLSTELKRDFRLLAVFPGGFTRKAASAVWGVPQAEAEDSLGTLLRYSLLEFEEATARYFQLDLIRLFALHKMRDREQRVARERHAEHYLKVVGRADALYRMGGKKAIQGLTLFDMEWGNIEHGQSWTVTETNSGNRALAEWCWKYADKSANCRSLRQYPKEALRWLLPACDAAHLLHRDKWEGNVLCNIGLYYEGLGQYRLAVRCHQRWLEISQGLQDRKAEGKAFCNMGCALHGGGDYRKAIALHEKHLEIAQEAPVDKHEEALAYANIGSGWGAAGEIDRADDFLNKAMAAIDDDPVTKGLVFGNLGNVSFRREQFDRAIELQDQALSCARMIGDRWGEAYALFNTAVATAKLGNRPAAERLREKAQQAFGAIGFVGASEMNIENPVWRVRGLTAD